MKVLKNMHIRSFYCGRFNDRSIGILNLKNTFDDRALERLSFLTPSLRTLMLSLTHFLSMKGWGTVVSFTLLHEKPAWNQSFRERDAFLFLRTS